MIFQPLAEPTRDHDRAGPMGKRKVSRNRTKAHAKSVKRDGRKFIPLLESRRPEFDLFPDPSLGALNHAEDVIDIAKPRTRNEPLRRHPAEGLAKLDNDPVLQHIEWREIDMPCFRLDDLVVDFVPTHEHRGAEPGARPDNRHDSS